MPDLIEYEMNVTVAKQRDRWVEAFLDRIEARGYGVHLNRLRKIRPEEIPKGSKHRHCKMPSVDSDTGAGSMTFMLEPGYECPPGVSDSEMELFVMTGPADIDGRKHGPGTCINHGAFQCNLGTLALGRTDSQLHNQCHFNPWTTPEENCERARARMLARKPELYRWVATGEHKLPADFEFPRAHFDEKGDKIWHHREGGDLRHDLGTSRATGAARCSRARKK